MIKRIIDFVLSFLGNRKVDISKQNFWNEMSTEEKAERLENIVVVEPKARPRYTWPVKNPNITSPYGWRNLPSGRNFHFGTDYGYGGNTFALVCEDCFIVKILRNNPDKPYRWIYDKGSWLRQGSNEETPTPYVVFQGVHSGAQYVHRHLRINKTLRPGQKLSCGDSIGKIDGMGNSFGAHCHIDIWPKEYEHKKHVDPHKWLSERIDK